MAAAAAPSAPGLSPGLCPSFAAVCSFLERYGALLDLPELTFPQLERYLRDTSSVPKLLVDLHVKLLRKIGKSVSADRWEKYLLKICQEFNTTWSWEMEQKGYISLSMESKTGILKYLCECQFDDNVKFKATINEEEAEKMRVQPIGRDRDGQMYWYQLDQDNNVRLYTEEQDDLDGSSWKCIVRDRNDLAEVVALLKTQIDPELLKRDLEAKAKEAEARTGEDMPGTEGKGKKSDDETSDEEHKQSSGNPTDVPVLVKDEERKAEEEEMEKEQDPSPVNEISVEVKAETELPSDKPSAETKVLIKEEPTEATPAEAAPAEATPAMTELSEERLSEQQAKIPLKKRGMKFTEGFEKSGSVIVPNQAAIHKSESTKSVIIKHVNGELPEQELLSEALKNTDTQESDVTARQSVEPVENAQTKESRKTKLQSRGTDSQSRSQSDQKEMELAAKDEEARRIEADVSKSEAVTLIGEALNNGEKRDYNNCLPVKHESVDPCQDTAKSKIIQSEKDSKTNDSTAEPINTNAQINSGIKVETALTAQISAMKSHGLANEVQDIEATSAEKADLFNDSKNDDKQKIFEVPLDKSKAPKKSEGSSVTKTIRTAKVEASEKPQSCEGRSQDSEVRDAEVQLDIKAVAPSRTSEESSKSEQNMGGQSARECSAPEKSEPATDEGVVEEQGEAEVCKDPTSSSIKDPTVQVEEKKEEENHAKEKDQDKVRQSIKPAEKLNSGRNKSTGKEEVDEDKDIVDGKDQILEEKTKEEPQQAETEASKTSFDQEDTKTTEQGKRTEEEDKKETNSEQGAKDEKRVARRGRKGPAHRRKAELCREEKDSESDTNNTGPSLRRSPRIRPGSRPAPQPVEKKAEPLEEEEEKEEEEVKPKKPREKKVQDKEQEGQPKKGRKRRKVRWTNTRTRRRKKSSGSEGDPSNEEEDEEEESEYEESEVDDDSDEDYKVERTRKRRGHHRQRRSSESSIDSDDLPPNEDPCKHCGLPNHPELILLCDSCDNGYHTACLRPPLMVIPDGEWFCPPCQHKQLCDKLEEALQNLDAALKKKERAERRKERLIYVGISVENIITPSMEGEEKPDVILKEKKESKKSKSWGRRSTRARKSISYRFDEFDEAIEEAIEEDIKEAEGGGAGRGKDMANITGLRGKDMSTILQDEGKENGRPPRPSLGQKRKKRRLNDLDSDSTVDEEESEDEFCLSDSSTGEDFVASDNSAVSEAGSNDSEECGSRRRGSRHKQPIRKSQRKRRRPRGYSDDEEDETDEDEEDEIATGGSSDYSSSDLDVSMRRSRRSRKLMVNYHETSESDGSQAETNRDKLKPRRCPDQSSDSSGSYSRGSSEEHRPKHRAKRRDWSDDDSRQRHRRLALKRRRASEDTESSSSSATESSEEDRPVRKRVNRIDSDDSDEEETKEKEEKDKEEAPREEEEEKTQTTKTKEEEEDESDRVKTKKRNEEDRSKASDEDNTKTPREEDKPRTTGDEDRSKASREEDRSKKAPEEDRTKNLPPTNGQGAVKSAGHTGTTPKGSATNGVSSETAPGDEEDEDDLLGVTDLVDYVCNIQDL